MPRKLASLEVGGFIDYASPARIMRLFNNDMSAIRKEYSRQRSIIRKRVERMEKAGLTHNKTFERFGDVKTQLPPVKSLSDRQLLEMISSTAHEIGAGYQNSTVSGIRQSRTQTISEIKDQAELYKDEELKQLLNRDMTDRQYDRMLRVMGMVERVIGYYNTSVRKEAMNYVLETGKSKRSLVEIAIDAITALGVPTGLQDDNPEKQRQNIRAQVADKYNREGKVKVSYKKAHKKRGGEL